MFPPPAALPQKHSRTFRLRSKGYQLRCTRSSTFFNSVYSRALRATRRVGVKTNYRSQFEEQITAKHEDVKNILPFELNPNTEATFDRLSLAIAAYRQNEIIPFCIHLTRKHSGIAFGGKRWVNYDSLRHLISGGSAQPPRIRAYYLKQQRTGRGIVLVDVASLLNFEIDQWNLVSNYKLPRVGAPNLPTFLTAPANGKRCPYTGLSRTVFYELASTRSPYGFTNIKAAPIRIGRGSKTTLQVLAQSLVEYIQTLPPPNYKLPPGSNFLSRVRPKPPTNCETGAGDEKRA